MEAEENKGSSYPTALQNGPWLGKDNEVCSLIRDQTVIRRLCYHIKLTKNRKGTRELLTGHQTHWYYGKESGPSLGRENPPRGGPKDQKTRPNTALEPVWCQMVTLKTRTKKIVTSFNAPDLGVPKKRRRPMRGHWLLLVTRSTSQRCWTLPNPYQIMALLSIVWHRHHHHAPKDHKESGKSFVAISVLIWISIVIDSAPHKKPKVSEVSILVLLLTTFRLTNFREVTRLPMRNQASLTPGKLNHVILPYLNK